MEQPVGDVSVHFVEHGEGPPLLALHGAGVDHREIEACLEPVLAARPSLRRIYPDLPGMGRTAAPDTVTSADDVLHVLLALVDSLAGDDQPLLVVGHSAGAYYAQAIADHRPDRVLGLALVCPLLDGIHDVPDRTVTFGSDELGDSGFRDYLTVRTPGTLARYEQYVAPGASLADHSALARIGERWQLTAEPGSAGPYERPTLVVTGRQDSTVGYARAYDLLDRYPRATFAVLDRAGHALPHEQPELLRALVTEWLDRVAEHASA